MQAATDHAEQLAALTVMVIALAAKIANPTENTSADTANASLREIVEHANHPINSVEIDATGFSRDAEAARGRIQQRVDEMITSIRFRD